MARSLNEILLVERRRWRDERRQTQQTIEELVDKVNRLRALAKTQQRALAEKDRKIDRQRRQLAALGIVQKEKRKAVS